MKNSIFFRPKCNLYVKFVCGVYVNFLSETDQKFGFSDFELGRKVVLYQLLPIILAKINYFSFFRNSFLRCDGLGTLRIEKMIRTNTIQHAE
jgi:hypothetical protein